MEELLIFIFTFLIVFTVYLIFIYIPNKRRNAKKINLEKQPMEIKLLVNMYKIDLKKANYNRLLMLICFISSIDIALIVSLVMMVNSFLLEIFIGLFSALVLIFLSYYPVGLYYKKRGKTK